MTHSLLRLWRFQGPGDVWHDAGIVPAPGDADGDLDAGARYARLEQKIDIAVDDIDRAGAGGGERAAVEPEVASAGNTLRNIKVPRHLLEWRPRLGLAVGGRHLPFAEPGDNGVGIPADECAIGDLHLGSTCQSGNELALATAFGADGDDETGTAVDQVDTGQGKERLQG